jgi:hypothetical protein
MIIFYQELNGTKQSAGLNVRVASSHTYFCESGHLIGISEATVPGPILLEPVRKMFGSFSEISWCPSLHLAILSFQ